ncbi:MAG TPA: cupin domain-containing protein [Acidimicrobiia bacterium]|nr:cupin domain-containing protein [Acidimicrobiia bacterium]
MSAAVLPPSSASVIRPPWGQGLEAVVRLDGSHGADNLDAAELHLAPGGSIPGHTSPFEESFYVLSGEVLVAIADVSYHLRPGDFGLIPFGYPSAWSNPFGEEATWLRVRAPRPRPDRPTVEHRPYPDMALPVEGDRVEVDSPHQRYVGHFDDSQIAPPGPLAMPGYHGYSINNVSIRMMVDDLLGAVHHTLFMVQFAPAEGFSASEHFHPFEELYYFVQGAADGRLEGEPCRVEAGDLVFAGVGATHGFTTAGDVPVRWIEAQAPMPPKSSGTIFVADWSE